MSRVQAVHSADEWRKAMLECKSFGGKAMLVDFTATWCGPCQRIAPVFEKLSSENPGIAFIKVDVDELADVAGECGVKAMPTFIAFFNGEQVETIVGADEAKLRAAIAMLNAKGGLGAGQKLGGAAAGAAGAPADDSPEARRARMLAAAEARSKPAA